MKRFLLIAGIILLVLLLSLALAPILFKDKIRERVDRELASALNAKAFYDPESFSVSFFRKFPQLSVSLERFGVVNVAPFVGDTLANVGRFSASLNVWSVISGDKIEVNSVELERPHISAVRLKDGRANWEIFKQDTTAADTSVKEPTQFSVQVKRWAITDGQVAFIDAQMPMTVVIHDLDHEGSGDFTQDVFDLKTTTHMGALSLEYDSVSYLSNKKIEARLDANIDQKNQKYTLRENELKINEMGIGLNGWVQMKEKQVISDLTFKTLNGSFKELLSLVPGIYTKDFDGLKADGEFEFSGLAKGVYEGDNLPKLVVDLKVKEGQFQYPKLPSAITGVQMDLHVDHPQGLVKNTLINLKSLALKVGKNPVQAHATVQGLEDMAIDGAINARLNLAEVSQAVPMEGLIVRGLLSINAVAKGVYSAARKRLPAVTADLSLLDGFVKSTQLPAPLERVQLQASVQNGTGRMEDTRIRIPSLSLMLEGEPFQASGLIEDLVNYRWDIAAKGRLDLAKLTKIYPIEGTKLAGKVIADIQTKGAMADVEAGHYDRLPTSGTLGLEGFAYSSTDLPQGVKADRANFRFNPAAVTMETFEGSLGRSDVKMSGSLANYLGYFLKSQTLRGTLDVQSNRLDVNEWMTSDPAPKPKAESAPMEAVQVPRNLDFTASFNAKEVLYDKMSLTNALGKAVVRDGIVKLEGIKCNALEGSVELSATYNSQNLGRPAYDANFTMNQVSLPALYQNFNSVKTLAPVAEGLGGKITTQFNLAGLLNEKMEPLYPTLQGGGVAKISGAQVQDVKLAQGLNQVAKLNLPSTAELKDILLKGKITNGRLAFEPFDFKLGSQVFNMSGSNGFDQSILYNLKTTLPSELVNQVASRVPQLQKLTGNAPIDMLFNVTGTHASPKVSLASVGKNATAVLKDQATARAKEEVDKLKKEAEDRARQEGDRLKKEAEDRARQEGDRLKKEAENKAKDELNKLKGKVKFPR